MAGALPGGVRDGFSMNVGWRYHKGDVQGADGKSFDDSGWEVVNVPHGLELLPEIHRLAPGVPVIFLTAHAKLDYAVQALRGGANDFLAKPIQADSLVEKATRLAKQGRRERAAAPKPLAVLAVGAACGALGVGLIATAFIGLPMVADMLILLGGGAAVIAIALVVIWLAVWLFIRMVIGWVRLLVRTGKRWCRKEIAA